MCTIHEPALKPSAVLAAEQMEKFVWQSQGNEKKSGM